MAVLKLTLLVFAVTLVSSAGIPASLRRGDGAARSSIVTSSSTGVAATGSSGLPKPAIDLDAKPKRGQSKPTTDVDSQQKDENETSVELKKAGSTGPSDATVLQKAATAHQARLSQRAKEELAVREKAREAAFEERTKRDKAGDKPRQFDPKKDKVTHTIANQVPDIETCGVRHCKDANFQLHLKYPRQPLEHFVAKCEKIYEDWKATVGYSHDCLDVNSTSLSETREPFPGFNNLRNAYEDRLKKIKEHKMERLGIFSKHSADDGAHHDAITRANRNETAEEENRQAWVDKTGELKIRRKQMSDRIKYNTEGKDIRRRPIGYVYEDGRNFSMPKPRKKVVEEAPEEGWGAGYSISIPNPARL